MKAALWAAFLLSGRNGVVMQRTGGRSKNELRPIRFSRDLVGSGSSSVVVQYGRTTVLCTASAEDRVPVWLRNKAPGGWLTAEYGMLPGASKARIKREASTGKQSPRTLEIQRLIGRALRCSVDLSLLGERTVTIDCDVLQADGGTRTASVTGGFVALGLLLKELQGAGLLEKNPLIRHVAAVSVGIVKGELLVDLDYPEDSIADVDLNIVVEAGGGLVEVQGSAERHPFSSLALQEMISLASSSLVPIFEMQSRFLGGEQ